MFSMGLKDRSRELADVELFGGCTRRQLRRIAPLTTMVDVSPGRTLCRQGRAGREFFVIVDGNATVTVDGVEVATLGPGCGFGEMALLSPAGRRTAEVTAATPMALLVLNRAEFDRLMDEAPSAARRILRDCIHRFPAGPQARGRTLGKGAR